MALIPRSSIMSVSSTLSSTLSQWSENGQSQFDVWSLIKRRSNENPFCMEAKFRAGKRLHRIRSTIVTRKRKHEDAEIEADDEASSTSSTDSSDDWLNGDDEEDDIFDIFERLNVNNSNKKLDLKSLATMLINQQKQHAVQKSVPTQRPASGDMFVLDELTVTGTRAQKLYLKKCADFKITPCSHFVKSLGTREIDLEHHNIGPTGAEACAFALTKAFTVRTVNMTDTGMGPRGAKYMALMLKENQRITDLNISDNCIGEKGLKYVVNVIIDVDKLYRLDLSGNDFLERDGEMIKLLMEEARTLKYLNLSHNEFREVGGELIGEALSWNDGLEELDLSWNHFRRRGSVGIAEGLQDNSSLQILNLSWNGFYLEGCRALVRALQLNTTLEVLDLSNNRINRECLGHLVKGLAKNTTLHTLILKFNPLTSAGAYDMIKFIHDCPTSGIRTLDLGVQPVDPDFVTVYKEILIQKRTLDVIYGQVIGHSLLNLDEIEQKILEENPSIVLLEFGKLMGFRLLDLFSSLDKDGSRTLDRDEIERGLRMANIPVSNHCLDRMIEKLDIDGDGEIDFAELMLAQQEYRKLQTKLLLAQEGQGDTKLEDTPLWRIKTLLLKLMAEKMADYPSFQRATEMLVKQIQVINTEKDAREDAQAKIRASQPRKVKSRPTSSVKSPSFDILVLSSSSPEHSDDDVILTPDMTTENNVEETRQLSGGKSRTRSLKRNFSVQLPLTNLERFLSRNEQNKDTTKKLEQGQRIFESRAPTNVKRDNDGDMTIKTDTKTKPSQAKQKPDSQTPKETTDALKTKYRNKSLSSANDTQRKSSLKRQPRVKETRASGSQTLERIQADLSESEGPEKQFSQRKGMTEVDKSAKRSDIRKRNTLQVPTDLSILNSKATLYPHEGLTAPSSKENRELKRSNLEKDKINLTLKQTEIDNDKDKGIKPVPKGSSPAIVVEQSQ